MVFRSQPLTMTDSGADLSPERGGSAAFWPRVYNTLCIFSLAVALAALAGWLFETRSLRAWLPSAISMNPLTALCFVALSAGLWRAKPATGELRTLRALGTIVAAIGAVQLCDLLFGMNFRLDHLLFVRRLVDTGAPVPNRMAPNTAIAFFCTGLVLLLMERQERATRVAQLILILNFLGVVFAVLGYAYSVDGLYRVGTFAPMALNTAFAFLALTGALTLHVKDRGIFAAISKETVGGQIARRMLPWVILVPPVLGWCRVRGEQAHLYDAQTGSAIMVLIWMVALGTVVLLTAHSMNAADEKRLEAERALEKRAAELQTAQRELEAFSYSVSHDLRAPLRHISGFIGLLEGVSAHTDPKAKRYIGIINDAAVQMGQLIDDLLTFSRLGRAELSNSELDLNTLLSEAIGTVNADLNGRNIGWRPEPLPQVQADPSMMRQVFLNLLQNAAKYSRNTPQAVIEIFQERTESGDLIIAVRDNGVGFDMKYADKLFGVFQRLHRSEEFEGTGIGLANVRRVIARHGGETWAKGEPNRGATFYFSLPKERLLA